VIGTDYTGSCKSSNHAITTTMKLVLQQAILPYQGLVDGRLQYALAN
jgi:hypothetical protein